MTENPEERALGEPPESEASLHQFIDLPLSEARLLAQAMGVETVRVVGPETEALSADYVPLRINLWVDGAGVVLSATHG